MTRDLGVQRHSRESEGKRFSGRYEEAEADMDTETDREQRTEPDGTRYDADTTTD